MAFERLSRITSPLKCRLSDYSRDSKLLAGFRSPRKTLALFKAAIDAPSSLGLKGKLGNFSYLMKGLTPKVLAESQAMKGQLGLPLNRFAVLAMSTPHEDIARLEREIGALREQRDRIKAEYTPLDNEVTKELAGISQSGQNKLFNADPVLRRKAERVIELKTQWKKLNEEVKEKKARLSQLELEAQSLGTRISNLHSELSGLRSTIPTSKEPIPTEKEKHDNPVIRALYARATALSQNIERFIEEAGKSVDGPMALELFVNSSDEDIKKDPSLMRFLFDGPAVIAEAKKKIEELGALLAELDSKLAYERSPQKRYDELSDKYERLKKRVKETIRNRITPKQFSVAMEKLENANRSLQSAKAEIDNYKEALAQSGESKRSVAEDHKKSALTDLEAAEKLLTKLEHDAMHPEEMPDDASHPNMTAYVQQPGGPGTDTRIITPGSGGQPLFPNLLVPGQGGVLEALGMKAPPKTEEKPAEPEKKEPDPGSTRANMPAAMEEVEVEGDLPPMPAADDFFAQLESPVAEEGAEVAPPPAKKASIDFEAPPKEEPEISIEKSPTPPPPAPAAVAEKSKGDTQVLLPGQAKAREAVEALREKRRLQQEYTLLFELIKSKVGNVPELSEIITKMEGNKNGLTLEPVKQLILALLNLWQSEKIAAVDHEALKDVLAYARTHAPEAYDAAKAHKDSLVQELLTEIRKLHENAASLNQTLLALEAAGEAASTKKDDEIALLTRSAERSAKMMSAIEGYVDYRMDVGLDFDEKADAPLTFEAWFNKKFGEQSPGESWTQGETDGHKDEDQA